MKTIQNNQKLRRRFGKYQTRRNIFYGKLGNASGVVEVPGSTGYVYVTPDERSTAIVVANLGKVAPQKGLRVAVGEDEINPGVLQILGMHFYAGASYENGQGVGPHAATHNRGGSDMVYIDQKQITNLLLFPSSGFTVQLYPGYIVPLTGGVIRIAGSYIDLSSYQATTGTRYIAVGLDGTTGAVEITDTQDEVDSVDLSLADLPVFPEDTIPIAWVRMYVGQTGISDSYTNSDIIDARWISRSVAQYLDNLIDVNVPSPGDGYVLSWDDGASEWVASPPTGTFLTLTDTPDDYTGYAGMPVVVNGTEDALEFGEGLSEGQQILVPVVLLDETAAAGGQAYFELTGISAVYDSIQITMTGKSEAADVYYGIAYIDLNGDTTNANYIRDSQLNGGNEQANDRRIGVLPSSQVANTAGGFTATILNPNDTVYRKAILSHTGYHTPAVTLEDHVTFLQWYSANAVTSIKLSESRGYDWAEGTRCIITGYKKAFVTPPGYFTELLDTPDDYTDKAGFVLAVGEDEASIDFVDPSAGTGQQIFAPVVLLDETAAAGGQANFTLSDIVSSRYNRIDIHLSGKSEDTVSTGEPIILTLNGDTTDANYRRINLAGTAGATSSTTDDTRKLGRIATSKNGDMSGQCRMTIENPAGTYRRTIVSENFIRESATVNHVMMVGGQWESANAITSIALTTDSASDFAEGTRCTITGWRKVFVTAPGYFSDLLDAFDIAGDGGKLIRVNSGADALEPVSTDIVNLASTEVVVNEAGSATMDFRAESDTEANMLLLDASADKLYMGGTTNGVEIPKGGQVALKGTARVKKEIIIPVSRVTVGASAPTATTRAVGASGNIKIPVLSFSKTVEQEVYFEVHAPLDLDNTVDVTFHIMWIPGSGWSAGNYMWKLEYLIKTESGVAINTGAPTTIQADVTPANAVNIIETEFASAIDLHTEQIMMARLYRDVANDNGDDTGELRFCEIEYTSDKLGEAT